MIVLYWIYGNWSTYLTILLPRYYDGRMPILMLICKLTDVVPVGWELQ